MHRLAAGLLEDLAQSLADDLVLAWLQHEHRNEKPLVTCTVYARRSNGWFAGGQLLLHLAACDPQPRLVPKDK